jgi:hypothetical protein
MSSRTDGDNIGVVLRRGGMPLVRTNVVEGHPEEEELGAPTSSTTEGTE